MTQPDIICLGATHWDLVARLPDRLKRGDDRPGPVTSGPGGVAFNLARGLAAAGLRVRLVSATGVGELPRSLIEQIAEAGVEPAFIHRPTRVDLYIAIEDADGLVGAVSDSRTLEMAAEELVAAVDRWTGPMVIDSNLPDAVLAALIPGQPARDLRLCCAGAGKVARFAPYLGHPQATFYLNRLEAEVLLGTALADARAAAAALLAAGAQRAVVTDGARAAVAAAVTARGASLVAALPPPLPVRRVTGAGDAFAAAHIAADLGGAAPEASLSAALAAAARHITETPQ